MRCPAVFGLDVPSLGLLVEFGADDTSVEGCVLLDVELALYVCEVVSKLLPAWVLLAPGPILSYVSNWVKPGKIG